MRLGLALLLAMALCGAPARRSAPRALVLAVQDAIAAGDLEGANRQLAAALKTYPDDGGLHNLLGILAAQKGEIPVAEAHFREAVRLAPGLRGAWLNLARAIPAARAPEAVAAWEKALALEPADEQAKDGLAAALSAIAKAAYDRRDLETALGNVARARDLRPDDASLHFFFGMVAVELDLPNDARKALLHAVELAPGEPWYRYALGAVTLQGFDAAEAVTHFEVYVRARPEDPRGRFALGTALYKAGRYPEAEKEFRAVLERPETAAGASYYLGRIAKADGELERSAELFARAVKANPAHADAHAELGFALLRLERMDEARAALDAALRLDKDNVSAHRALLALYQQTGDARLEAQRERLAEAEKAAQAAKTPLLRALEIRPQ